ncbi:MAG: L-glutamate gamma-semialdehyde dehydrogenase [Candidatus Schekmanbacteria bacterium]|nr:L-glutamate gamma-semialdehyde dehydrogenase [Candidatus Schekmanbacteria bacterium]
MLNALVNTPAPQNEPVLSYAPESAERTALKAELRRQRAESIEIPLFIGGREVRTHKTGNAVMPHYHRHVLASYHIAEAVEIEQAIAAARKAKTSWAALPWEARAAIFLKAAELLTGPRRARVNAANMLGASKTAHQAEIDGVCELADFWRFGAAYAQRICEEQPISAPGTWNYMDHRPLDGFVLAVTPFNFLSIAGNLPTAPALMGNTVLWKPASSAVYQAWHVLEVLREAGLPDGVINLVTTSGATVSQEILPHPNLAGIHFTGSTEVFRHMWATIGSNIDRYSQYPRIVGETGGKDFIFAHASADPEALVAAIIRGGYEFQGQKCSAVSRVYIPDNLWPRLSEHLVAEIKRIRVGDVADFRNFMGAVVDRGAFASITGFIEKARTSPATHILAGGAYDDSEGYFIQPTLVRADDPLHPLMCEEIFGPVVTLYVYPEADFESTLHLCDTTSPYALTGAIFARDRTAIVKASQVLRFAAGNFYINDKPTGAVVGQQPFGGSRASGTNDKAGSVLNLLRWVSPRAIKETFAPATSYPYPFMAAE